MSPVRITHLRTGNVQCRARSSLVSGLSSTLARGAGRKVVAVLPADSNGGVGDVKTGTVTGVR